MKLENELNPPRFDVKNWAFTMLPREPLEEVIKNMYVTPSVNVLVGDAGVGKTWVTIFMGVCLAAGMDYLDFEIAESKRVLYIDEESGSWRFTLRQKAAFKGAMLPEDTDLPFFFVSMSNLELSNREDEAELQSLIEEMKIDVCFIDSLSMIAMGDENSKEDMQVIFKALRRIADQTRCAFVVIHHIGKSGLYRGSTAIKQSLDSMITMTKSEGSTLARFVTTKNRDGALRKFAADLHWSEGGEPEFWMLPCEFTSEGGAHSKSKQFVIDYLEEHGESYRKKIIEVGEERSIVAAERAIKDLVIEGTIHRTNQGGRGVAAIYDLTEKK